MTDSQLHEWWNRPTTVRVLDLCPRCTQLVEGVTKHVIYSGFGTKIEETCCSPCAEAVREEYNGVIY